MLYTGHAGYFLPKKIRDYNAIIDGRKFFDQLVKNDLRTYDNIQKIATGQEDNYASGYLLDYTCLKNILRW